MADGSVLQVDKVPVHRAHVAEETHAVAHRALATIVDSNAVVRAEEDSLKS